MDEIFRENVAFIWNKGCIDSFEILKNKLIKSPILIFLDWSKKIHVHIDASTIFVEAILTHLGDDHMDHPNEYSSRNLNKAERN